MNDVHSSDYIDYGRTGVAPVLYLNSNIKLDGKGTEDNPYTITTYTKASSPLRTSNFKILV